jgi:AraC-like DNA-binding protein
MIAVPPGITQADFLRVLEEVIRFLSVDPPNLCGSVPWTAEPEETLMRLFPFPRIAVQLEGRYCHAASVLGKRVEVELRRGQCIYWVPHSWSIPSYSTTGEVLGIVLRPDCIRLLHDVLTGLAPTEESRRAYHTALPLAGAGAHVVRALNNLAEMGKSGPAARELVAALLHLVREHLADDHPARHSTGRAVETWRAVQTYLEENFGREVNRESVANVMGLHPNYLSALARQMGGQSFTEALEGVRMNQARRLLLDTDLKLVRIAALCGYRDATRFGKVFRRLSGATPGSFRGQGKKPA